MFVTASVARALVLLLIAEGLVLAGPLFLPAGKAWMIAVPALLAAVAMAVLLEALRGDTLRDALALRLPVSRRAWLVALLPAVTILFAQLLNPGGLVWIRPLPAILVAIVTEIAFRGFLFLRLRRAGASFFVAAIIPGLISLTPYIVQLSTLLAVVTFAGLVAQSIWLAWLVERWKSVWIAIASMLLLSVGLRGFSELTDETWVWMTLLLRFWVIGMSVALTHMLQRRRPGHLVV